MQNKPIRLGPTAVPAAAGNIWNPPILSGGVNPPAGSLASYYLLTHIRVINKSANAVPFSAWIGATGGSAAGTEFMGTAVSVPANSYIDWYGRLRLDTADFLTALAGTVTTLVMEAEGEIGVN